MRRVFLIAPLLAAPYALAAPATPSFSCDKVKSGSMDALICSDPALAAADKKLADVYAAATARVAAAAAPVLKAEQRGWLKGRDECWKQDDKPACVAQAYRWRIAELQARYRLVPTTDTAVFVCDGERRNEVSISYFKTEPLTLTAEYDGAVSLMYLQASASGTHYQGRNESLWEHQGMASITWGAGAPEMRCIKAQ